MIAPPSRRSSGQSSIELALFLPLFLLILLGMVELGHAWHGANKAAQAAHEGAEYARRLRTADVGGVEAVVTQVAGPLAVSSIATSGSSTALAGTLVTVTVAMDLPLLTGTFLTLFGPFEDGVVHIERSATAMFTT